MNHSPLGRRIERVKPPSVYPNDPRAATNAPSLKNSAHSAKSSRTESEDHHQSHLSVSQHSLGSSEKQNRTAPMPLSPIFHPNQRSPQVHPQDISFYHPNSAVLPIEAKSSSSSSRSLLSPSNLKKKPSNIFRGAAWANFSSNFSSPTVSKSSLTEDIVLSPPPVRARALTFERHFIDRFHETDTHPKGSDTRLTAKKRAESLLDDRSSAMITSSGQEHMAFYSAQAVTSMPPVAESSFRPITPRALQLPVSHSHEQSGHTSSVTLALTLTTAPSPHAASESFADHVNLVPPLPHMESTGLPAPQEISERPKLPSQYLPGSLNNLGSPILTIPTPFATDRSDRSVLSDSSSNRTKKSSHQSFTTESEETTLPHQSVSDSPTGFSAPSSADLFKEVVEEDGLDDDWEDAAEGDVSDTRSVRTNRSGRRRHNLHRQGFVLPPVPPMLIPVESEKLEATLASQDVICIEVQRRSLAGNHKRTSSNSASPSKQSDIGGSLSGRTSLISVVSVSSRISTASASATDDGGEFEDAADRAEWMDIDGGGAYEDLDKAEQITREVSRQAAFDQTQALKSAAEARRRYSALSEAQRISDTVLVAPLNAHGGSRRIARQFSKENIHPVNGTETPLNRRYSGRLSYKSDSTAASSLRSTRSFSCSEHGEVEPCERCKASSPSSSHFYQHRDSTSSRGSRVMLFTRNARPPWGRNSPRLEDTGELDPIVEVDNGQDNALRNMSASPFSLDSQSGHGHSDPSSTALARWRPRPLFLKPAGPPPGHGKRHKDDSSYEGSSCSSHAEHSTTFESKPEPRDRNNSAPFASRPKPSHTSSDNTLSGTQNHLVNERKRTSDSEETSRTQDLGQSQVLWPCPPRSSSFSSIFTSHTTGMSKDRMFRVSPERKVSLVVDQYTRPSTACMSMMSRPDVFGIPNPRPRLQSLSNLRSIPSRGQTLLPTFDANYTLSSPIPPFNFPSQKEGHLQQVGALTLGISPREVSPHSSISMSSGTFVDVSSSSASSPLTSSKPSVCLSPRSTDGNSRTLEHPLLPDRLSDIRSTASPSRALNYIQELPDLSADDVAPMNNSATIWKRELGSYSMQGDMNVTSNRSHSIPNGFPPDQISDASRGISKSNLRSTSASSPFVSHSQDKNILSASDDVSQDFRPPAPSRSRTFGRSSYPRLSPPLPITSAKEDVKLEDPFFPNAAVKAKGGALEKVRRLPGPKKAVSACPISPAPFTPTRDSRSSMKPAFPQTSFEGARHITQSPKDIATLADSNSSALSSWPSWAGKSKPLQTEPAQIPSPTASAFTRRTSTRVPSGANGNSSVMDLAYESHQTSSVHLEDSSQPYPLTRTDMVDSKSSPWSSPASQVKQSIEPAWGRSPAEIRRASVITPTSTTSGLKMSVLDIVRDPTVETALANPTLRMIRGRSQIISCPIRLEADVEADALWKMIKGRSSDNKKKGEYKAN